jgi:hypothetical protein
MWNATPESPVRSAASGLGGVGFRPAGAEPRPVRQDGMLYEAIHPLTTFQSRFSKNASTYEGRSVW